MRKGAYKDISNRKYGMLTAIRPVGKNEQGRMLWECRCDCGKIMVSTVSDITRGHTKSCGCLKREKSRCRMTTHGKSYTRLYRIWVGMKKRIYNLNEAYYKDYGGRGLKMCEEWTDNFMNFYAWAINNGYADNLSIDRKDNDKGYFPDNCKWSTAKEQANNRRARGCVV